jgi:predicted PurR-regulated permease PerM
VDQVRVLTGTTLQNAIGWVAGIATVLVNIVFCLIISVYLMLDGRRIVAGALTLTPRPYRPQMTGILQSINDNFGGFIRGQLILAVVYALGVAFVMWVSGLNYKAISAIFAAVAMLIPFVGPFISIIPPLLIALFSNPGDVWWVALLLIIMQQLVLNVVGPRVFGHTVNMHPLLVIGSALAGASVAGIWGALFGIPVAGIVASIVRRVYLNQQTRDAALSTASQPAALATEVTDAATPSDDAAPRPPGVPARRRDSA